MYPLASADRSWLEKTLWGLRDQEAGWIGAEVLNTNGSHDMGPLQVNSFWVPRLAALTGRSVQDIRFWLINDPCFNVQAARWIFLSGLSLDRKSTRLKLQSLMRISYAVFCLKKK